MLVKNTFISGPSSGGRMDKQRREGAEEASTAAMARTGNQFGSF